VDPQYPVVNNNIALHLTLTTVVLHSPSMVPMLLITVNQLPTVNVVLQAIHTVQMRVVFLIL
jgi:hypothetical protein